MEKVIFEKPIMVIDKIIYPKSFTDIIYEYKPDKPFNIFLNADYVRCLVIVDTDESRLDSVSNEIINMFYNSLETRRVFFLNDEDLTFQIAEIKKQLQSGIHEQIYHDWFMKLMFMGRQMSVPLKENSLEAKEGYNPKIVQYFQNFDTGLCSKYLFFSTNGILLEEPVIQSLISKAIEEVKKITSKPKKIMNKRNPLDHRLRHEVFKRDNYKCKECGATKQEKSLHCDHILPVSQGGTDELDNLQTLCIDCNLAKSNKCFKVKETNQ